MQKNRYTVYGHRRLARARNIHQHCDPRRRSLWILKRTSQELNNLLGLPLAVLQEYQELRELASTYLYGWRNVLEILANWQEALLQHIVYIAVAVLRSERRRFTQIDKLNRLDAHQRTKCRGSCKDKSISLYLIPEWTSRF